MHGCEGLRSGHQLETAMPKPERPPQPHRLRQGDAQDHQGHADGGRRQAAPRPGGGDGRASLCGAHGRAARQPRTGAPTGRRPQAAGRHRQGRCAPARRHDRRARPVRRLQLQHRQAGARQTPSGCAAGGKTVKILTVGRKGADNLRRDLWQPDRRPRRLARPQADRLRRRQPTSPARCSRCSRPASSTSRRSTSPSSSRS